MTNLFSTLTNTLLVVELRKTGKADIKRPSFARRQRFNREQAHSLYIPINMWVAAKRRIVLKTIVTEYVSPVM